MNNEGTESEDLSRPPALKTRNMCKQARNRFYAQTSRARHRLYVANLEKEREILLKRLSRLEEENSMMSQEIMELKMENPNNNIYNNYNNYNTPSSSFSSSSFSSSTSFALSVLDFNRSSSLGPNSFDSPLKQRLLSIASALLVSEKGQRPHQMNWKSKFCCRQSEEKKEKDFMGKIQIMRAQMIRLIRELRIPFHLKNSKVLQLRLINLLKTYLQQSIK